MQEHGAATLGSKNRLYLEDPSMVVKHRAHLFRDLSLRPLCCALPTISTSALPVLQGPLP